jgi:hypothetical protein
MEETPVRSSIILAFVCAVVVFLIFYLITPLGLGVAFMAALATFVFVGLANYSMSSTAVVAYPTSTAINVQPPVTQDYSRYKAEEVMGQFSSNLPQELRRVR